MSSEKFETLDEDVQVLLEILQKKCSGKLEQCFGEEKKQVIADVERGLDEARQAIFEMEAEARAAPGSFRMDMIGRVRRHQDTCSKLALLIKSSKQAEMSLASSRGTLLENQSTAAFSQNRGIDNALQTTVRQGTAVLERTSQSLYRTTQVALESEEIGTGVIQELSQQREVLVRTRDRLTETDAELGRSRRILKSMSRVAMTNKLVLIVIILLEICILTGLVYYKFFS
ncbi:vesicle transport through interaction with t-SNAREs homolog 1B-like [Daphnia pulicaria]|uniref:vesicle transport through interaction with t-SNAREs homolog 1B-like n=1 Tax=Daphnia pulicaria TaxID=35523 RepID=UPI001EEBB915|nr:vesicle transport through interaction with t-SNAREs homolog 1B-like [Daphnia pulicaria]